MKKPYQKVTMKISVALICAVFALFLADVLCQSGGRSIGGGWGMRCPDGRPGSGSCTSWSSRGCRRGMYCYTSGGGGGGRGGRGGMAGGGRGICCRDSGSGGGQCPRPMGRPRCGRGRRGGSGGSSGGWGGPGGGRSCRGDWECRRRNEKCCWDGCMRTCMRVRSGPWRG